MRRNNFSKQSVCSEFSAKILLTFIRIIKKRPTEIFETRNSFKLLWIFIVQHIIINQTKIKVKFYT